jgi:hypothetical protein
LGFAEDEYNVFGWVWTIFMPNRFCMDRLTRDKRIRRMSPARHGQGYER